MSLANPTRLPRFAGASVRLRVKALDDEVRLMSLLQSAHLNDLSQNGLVSKVWSTSKN